MQTLENNPAFINGGPFANIAHGCNSVVSTKLALKLADYVVTEAGFGADLGAEKFFDIKCRKSGLKPDAVVLVATTKALKMHGGIAKDNLGGENVDAVTKGCKNLERHIENITKFGVPVIVAINDYVTDTKDEHDAIINYCKEIGVECRISSHWEKGGKGASDLAEEVVKIAATGVINLEFTDPRNPGIILSFAIANGKRDEAKTPELAIDIKVITPTTAAKYPK